MRPVLRKSICYMQMNALKTDRLSANEMDMQEDNQQIWSGNKSDTLYMLCIS